MRVVVISNCDPISTYVIRHIARTIDVQAILRPVRSLPSVQWRSLSKRRIGGKLRHLLFYNWRWTLLERRISQALHQASRPPPLEHVRSIPVGAFSTPHVADQIRSLRPDVLLVSGAPRLGLPILQSARLALNVHYGIAPHYRGEDTLFWPLYYQDYADIGVTLHQATLRVDCGPIVAQAYPALDETDTEVTIWTKCAQLAAEITLDFLLDFNDDTVCGREQRAPGRFFSRSDRKLRHDVVYLFRRHVLGVRPVRMEKRVINYYSSAKEPPLAS